MRRVTGIVLLVTLFAGLPGGAHGQDAREYGFAIGYNLATLSSSTDVAVHSAFMGGGIARQPLTGPLSVQGELLLHQKGGQVKQEDGRGLDVGVGYVEVPVLVHLETSVASSVSVHGEAGGYGAVKLFERLTPGSGNLNFRLPTNATFYRRFDAGLAGGLGTTFSIRQSQFNVTVRYELGLVDVARDGEASTDSRVEFPESAETRTWSIVLRFGL